MDGARLRTASLPGCSDSPLISSFGFAGPSAPMADLLDQLSESFGDTYTIERELGGGGMSRVFLAREPGLNRRVVVKVLPPETAAEMSV